MKIAQQLWKKANISNIDFAFGKVRHTIVTHFHSKNPEFKECLAQQMQHSSTTASKYYKDLNKTKEAQENFQKFQEELKNPKQTKKSRKASVKICKSRRSLTSLERTKIRKYYQLLVDTNSIDLPLKMRKFKEFLPADFVDSVRDRMKTDGGDVPNINIMKIIYESVRSNYRK